MIQEAIAKVVEKRDLSETEMTDVMEEITEGAATPAQIGAFITALRMKGEVVDEITAAARVLRNKSERIRVKGSKVSLDRDEINLDQETIVDTCGTGGDGAGSFNISTTTAFVVAAGGLKVAKHGNRSVSSLCGSADVVEALGVNLGLGPEQVGQCIDEIGIGFLYAPALHGAMRHVIGPRREIGLRTIFNILGPLANPASACVQVLGVYEEKLTTLMAQALARLGCKSAFVVHGHGGYDEISVTGPSKLSRLANGRIIEMIISPEELGIQLASPESIKGGNAQANAEIIRSVLKGENGPKKDITLLNAAPAFMASGLVKNLKGGVDLARELIDSGKAMEKLRNLVDLSVSFDTRTPAAAG
jgi:anthranilate phosphoribosyltransferase